MEISNSLVKYIKQLSHYFSASLIPMVLNLVINPLVSMNMNPEDFAITGYYTSFSTLISPVIVFYMLHYYNKRYFELDERGREHLRALLFKALIFFSFLVSVVCLLILLFYIKIFTNNSFPTFPYLYMAVLIIPFTGIYNLELVDYKMRRESKSFLHISVFKGIALVGAILLFVVFLKLGAMGKLLAPLFIEILFFIYLLYKHRYIWQIRTSVNEIFPILKFCWPLVLGAALGYFSNGYDKTVLEVIGNVDEFGYYCVGTSIAGYLGIFISSISATFQPDTYESIILNNKPKLLRVISIRLGLTLLVVLGFILFCPIVVKLLTAGKYMASVPYARVFALVAFASSIYYLVNDYSIAVGRPRLYLMATIIGSILIIFLMPLFVKHYLYIGAAYMVVISYVVLSIINLILLFFSNSKSR